MEAVRTAFHKIESEETLMGFLDKMEDLTCDHKIPYEASAIMRKAEFTGWPFKKLSYFKEGKELLEKYIRNNPDDLEARYVRILTQSSVPSLLNYSDELEEDRLFIDKHLPNSDLPDSYKETMLANLKKTEK